MSKLTHLNDQGEVRMVDVGAKVPSQRAAVASARIRMQPATLDAVLKGLNKKGDVLAVARVAGIQAAKKCWELIPLCHPLMLNSVTLDIEPCAEKDGLVISAQCRVDGKTGVEMEALTAVSVAALTIYDMCKAVDRGMVIEQVRLLRKQGGKSGDWLAAEADDS